MTIAVYRFAFRVGNFRSCIVLAGLSLILDVVVGTVWRIVGKKVACATAAMAIQIYPKKNI